MKHTRQRYQRGYLRRVPRANNKSAWEYRYADPQTGKEKSMYFSTEQFPTQTAVERHLEIHAATQRGVRPRSIQHVIAPEEAFPFLADGSAIAFIVKAGALLIARNGVTVRPLKESSLRLKTCLVCRADDDSKIASEFVRAYMRKMPDKTKHKQLPLPISA